MVQHSIDCAIQFSTVLYSSRSTVQYNSIDCAVKLLTVLYSSRLSVLSGSVGSRLCCIRLSTVQSVVNRARLMQYRSKVSTVLFTAFHCAIQVKLQLSFNISLFIFNFYIHHNPCVMRKSAGRSVIYVNCLVNIIIRPVVSCFFQFAMFQCFTIASFSPN